MAALLSSGCFTWFGSKPKLLRVQKSPARVAVVASAYLKWDKYIKVGVLGASELTGAELIPVLVEHPSFQISLMTAPELYAGRSIEDIYPHLNVEGLPNLVAINDADFSELDCLFSCLPHGESQETIKDLPSRLKIVDLSGGFNLRNPDDYYEQYLVPHKAPELQKEAVYGLPELHREKIKTARLVGNPSCHATSVLLALVPLVKALPIDCQNIMINTYLGTMGPARSPAEEKLYPRIHKPSPFGSSFEILRSKAEIIQELSLDANALDEGFEGYIVPWPRGVMSNISLVADEVVRKDVVLHHLEAFYKWEKFVMVGVHGDLPKDVQDTNLCRLKVMVSRKAPGWIQVNSGVDHRFKGGPGQAVQNMNLLMGIPECSGLDSISSSMGMKTRKKGSKKGNSRKTRGTNRPLF